jgi:hypothetical protein
MSLPTPPSSLHPPLSLWGGVECTLNRVGDRYLSQLEMSGHWGRDDDLERFAELGVAALRYPVLWERTEPDGPASADWRWSDPSSGWSTTAAGRATPACWRRISRPGWPALPQQRHGATPG